MHIIGRLVLLTIAFFPNLPLLTLGQNYNYIGGAPLRVPGACPSGTVNGQITFLQNCCAAGQTYVKVQESVCCPDGKVPCYIMAYSALLSTFLGLENNCLDNVMAAPKV